MAAVAALVLGLASSKTLAHRTATALPAYGRLPDFSLTDDRGEAITREMLAGSVWVADFIFTRCAGQCPLMSAQMSKLRQALGDRPGLRFVSFSVDPSYDTPEILAAYAARYGATPDRWLFVTGAHDEMTALAQQGFHLGLGEGGSPQEPITHSVRLVLVDQRGVIRGYYDATEVEAMGRLQDDARRLLRQGPS